MNNEEIDLKIDELLKKVEEKRKEINSAEKPKWKTNLAFRYDDKDKLSSILNIAVLTNERDLIDIVSFLKIREQSWNNASSFLGSNLKFEWLGFSVNDWCEDVKNRLTKIKMETKRKELADYEEKLNNLMSLDQRRRKEIEKIMKSLE